MIEKSPVSPPVMPKKSQDGGPWKSDFVRAFGGLGDIFLYFFWGRGDSIYMAWMMMDDDDDDDENENDDIP